MPTILITGGTGFIGKSLSKSLLAEGHRLIILTRKITDKQTSRNLTYALWDIKERMIDITALQQADHIIHLAGAGVIDKRWTASYKKEIVESRTESSRLLVDALKNNSNRVKTIVSSSAIGWYGADSGDKKHFTEPDDAAGNFLGQTCKLWEESIEPVIKLNKRLVKLRTGIVLGNEGGALPEFKRSIRFGIAAILGNGKQMISWIHINDLCRLFINAIENEELTGTYNAVAPNPVSNKILTLCLAKKMRGKFYIPVHVPSFIIKLMLGKRSIEVLKSATVSCEKISGTGFRFGFNTIEAALSDLLKK